MTDIKFLLKSNNIDYSNISADDIKFIKQKLIPRYDLISNPILNEFPDMFNEIFYVDGEMRTFTFKDMFNMLNSVVNSFTA